MTDSVLRAHKPGWVLIAMHDPAGRRGLWYRRTDNAIEICAGREGDDDFCRVPLDNPAAGHLEDCLDAAGYAAWLAPVDGPDGFAAWKRGEYRRDILLDITELEADDPDGDLEDARADLVTLDEWDEKWADPIDRT